MDLIEKIQVATLALLALTGLGWLLDIRWLFLGPALLLVGSYFAFMSYAGIVAYREMWQSMRKAAKPSPEYLRYLDKKRAEHPPTDVGGDVTSATPPAANRRL
jgi:hypothetical protein